MKKKFYIKKIKLIIRKIFMKIYQVINGIDSNKIVFSSFDGKQYSDSGRFICEKLHQIDGNIKIVWLLNANAMNDEFNIIPKYVKKVKNTSLNIMREIATCKVYVTNESFVNIYKNKKQMFIDTWHGDRGFKKILHEAYENGKRPIPVYDNNVADYCVAASNYGIERYRKAFLYKGNILNVGMPRNDALVNGCKNKEKIKKRIGLKDEKVLLYAPTFRDNNKNNQNCTIDFDKIISVLSKDEEKWILITRSHPSSSGLDIKINKNKVLDLKNYPDMSDILQITDFLITDYSSSATDFALTYKPIILYLYDYDEYKKNCREFCADPKKVGFIYAETERELINLIKNMKEKDYIESCKKANKYYGINETGNSTQVICDIITEFARKE